MSEQRTSRVLVHTGDGKGKSSSAFGVMGRAWARGWKVGVVQFVKGPEWKTGEQKLGAHLGVDWHTLGDGFTWDSEDMDETRAVNQQAWQVARHMLQSHEYDLLIFDELTYLLTWEWIDHQEVVDAIRSRNDRTHVIVTGRDAPQALIDIADTVTEMRKIKHAFDAGIIAKKGIEY